MTGHKISNRKLVWILVITIVISVAGTVANLSMIRDRIMSLRITANSVGVVQVKIMAFVAMNIVSSDIDFGSGAINQTTDLSTEQVNPGTFNKCIETNGTYNHTYECRGIQIDNVGNTFINITMESDQNGNSLFLGDNSTDEFRFAVAPGNLSRAPLDSCNVNGRDGESLFPGGTNYINGFMNWTPVNQSVAYAICQNFSFLRGNNSLVIEVKVTVPADEGNFSPGQERVAHLAFVGEEI